jgi:hypothetical protein
LSELQSLHLQHLLLLHPSHVEGMLVLNHSMILVHLCLGNERGLSLHHSNIPCSSCLIVLTECLRCSLLLSVLHLCSNSLFGIIIFLSLELILK